MSEKPTRDRISGRIFGPISNLNLKNRLSEKNYVDFSFKIRDESEKSTLKLTLRRLFGPHTGTMPVLLITLYFWLESTFEHVTFRKTIKAFRNEECTGIWKKSEIFVIFCFFTYSCCW